MAGRIGSVHKAQDGQSYGFVLYDEQDRACVYLGFSTWHQVANFVSYAGVGLIAIGLVLPLLRPHLLIAWAIAIGLAIVGALCMGVSQRLLDDD